MLIRLQQMILNNSIPEPNTGCWLWLGSMCKGYGRLANSQAHRVSYIAFKGEIARGLEPDHLCKMKCCVNPDHLESVTHKENMQRSPHTKITDAEAEVIRSIYAQGHHTTRQLASLYTVNQSTISRIIRGRKCK